MNRTKCLNLLFLFKIAVIVVPRTSIMGEIDARSKTVIKVSAVAALGILVIGSVLICFLTRRMSTEMQLRQELIRQLVAKHKAEQSSNHKTQFLANMRYYYWFSRCRMNISIVYRYDLFKADIIPHQL